VQYDRAFNVRLADEVEALPWNSATVEALADYATLRDMAAAACE